MEHADPATSHRLAAFVEIVRRWAPRLDLVSPGDVARLSQRHVEDSLRALPLLAAAPEGRCIDVGSGAGLPGIPLAIASGRPWRLLEPRRKRAAFLEEALRELELDSCEVVVLTAEAAAATPALAASHAVATARALAPPPEAERLCRPLVAPGGSVVLFVGSNRDIPLNADQPAPGLLRIRVDGD